MSDFHCLEIDFPYVDFSNYGYHNREAEIKKIHHAHLYLRKDEIELRIFFDKKTAFGDSLMHWTSLIDPNKFGSHTKIELTKNHTNENLTKIDLTETKFIGCKASSDFHDGGKNYIIVNIDSVKFYWNPVVNKSNTAEFYMDDKGFCVVESFYSYLSPNSWIKNDGNFKISRMKNSAKFYKLANSSFRPEFNFISKDNRKSSVATIIKEPKIQFKYKKDVKENDAILYGDIVLMLASFYYHIKINFIFRRIHLLENTITIKNIEQKNFHNQIGNLWGFEIYWDFNKFLQASWEKEILKNYVLLSKAISLFNQSHLVDDYSAFLIRYNIIEICDKQKKDEHKFNSRLNKRQTNLKKNQALLNLLETIEEKDHEEFKKRWQNIQSLLQFKPMKNQLFSFLESQKLDPNTFPIKLDDLKRLRDNITHGSIDNVDLELLRKSNILLYRISGILILNLLGIHDWKLNTEIK